MSAPLQSADTDYTLSDDRRPSSGDADTSAYFSSLKWHIARNGPNHVNGHNLTSRSLDDEPTMSKAVLDPLDPTEVASLSQTDQRYTHKDRETEELYEELNGDSVNSLLWHDDSEASAVVGILDKKAYSSGHPIVTGSIAIASAHGSGGSLHTGEFCRADSDEVPYHDWLIDDVRCRLRARGGSEQEPHPS